MDGKTSLLLLSAVVQLIHLESLLTSATPHRPTVEILPPGHSRVFTHDTVTLKCKLPDLPYTATWTYNWYNGHVKLTSFGEQLELKYMQTKDSGKYYCKAFRTTEVLDVPTYESLPVEISVDGGWAILDAPSKGVVGYPMNMTCRVRGKRPPPIKEVVLYRDGVEVFKQEHLHFMLDNVTLEDWGAYTCIVSWNHDGRTHSITSSSVSVQVVEPLTQPTLFIVDDKEVPSFFKLVCVLDYNVPAPAPPVLYYFYIDKERLGSPTSENFFSVIRSRGSFSCEARVSQLGISRWSEPKAY